MLTILLSVAIALVSGGTPTPPASDELAGLWGAEAIFGPQVQGELTLEGSPSKWTISIAGFEVSVPRSGNDIRATFPGGQGELRVRVEDDGTVVRGFWIQPPNGRGSYASPVLLRRVSAHAWRGTVAPFEDTLSMYLSIQRQEDGTLHGSFYNPDMNWNGRAAWFRVEKDDENVNLIDPATGKTRFRQRYDASQHQIIMDFGSPFALTPRTPEQAVGFFPRSPSSTFTYRAPLPRGDGWPTARAREVGMDEARLTRLIEHVIATPQAPDAPRIHSIVVARHGKLVLEEYFFGFSPERTHDLRSASKTVTSVMAGIVMDRNKKLTLDTPIDGLPGITLAHLLTHSSGLACDDNDDASPGNEDTMEEQHDQPDWYRYFAALPVKHPPGTTYAYCSAGINFAAGVVAKAAGTSLLELFDREVARPLGIEHYSVNLMPNGEPYGGGGMYLRPRDFLKIGQTYLNGGTWNGKRVVSKEWVMQSTAHHIDGPDGVDDGYGWHRQKMVVGDQTHQTYMAGGNGGQLLIVVPDLDVVVVITAGNYGQYRVWKTFRDQLVPEEVLGAVKLGK